MNEKINLVNILKDAPKGTKLWSSICGWCTLLDVSDNESDVLYPISCETVDRFVNKSIISFTKYGAFCSIFANSECALFPSKENRDWSTFKAPKKQKEFEPFQKVLRVDDNNLTNRVWATDFYSHYDETICKHFLASGFIKDDDDIIPYEGNEDMLGKVVK